jgi:AcrR family transcriptional regulator
MARRTAAQDTLRGMRRGQIVAAARELVAAEGLEALTVSALEQKLGYTRGVITYHFRDKDEIVAALLESALAEIDAATQAEVDRSATPADKVRAVLRANLRGFVEHREAGLILLSFWGRLGSDPDARRANSELYARYRRRTSNVLEAGARAGAFASIDVQPLAALIVGVVIGLAAQIYFEPGSIDADAALGEAAQSILLRLQSKAPRGRARDQA